MARKPAARVKQSDKSTLLLALDHVHNVISGPAVYAPFCKFELGWLVGYDGIVAAGHKVTESLDGLAPHTDTMRHALMRAGNPFALTVKQDCVTVRGDAVRVDVPTMPAQAMPWVQPDYAALPVTPEFVNALVCAAKITVGRSDRVIASSVLVKPMSCVGTNGNTILEVYHGNNLPGNILVPAEFVSVLARVKSVPTHCGFSNDAFTLWFGADAWLRCNTYNEAYPDTDVIFAQMISGCQEYRPVPPDMLVALETLKPFVETGEVAITPYGVNAKPDLTGASYQFQHHMPVNAYRAVPYEALRQAALHGQQIAFSDLGFYWYGNVVRGATKA